MIQKRDIVVNLLLTIFTCGIYGIVWFVTLSNDSNTVSNDSDISGGLSLLLLFITCGLYGIYWSYKLGKQVYSAKVSRDIPATDNSILYLILSILGLTIINYCLIQSELNEIAVQQ